MKAPKSIQWFSVALFITAEFIVAQDFKIAPDLPVPYNNNFYNVSVASDSANGFLVTWVNYHEKDYVVFVKNYACRLSKTGAVLDSAAVYLSESYWTYCCPSAVFAGGHWIVAMNQDILYEWVGAQRLTASGTLLDNEPVNILPSKGMATIQYPTLATNGREILCVTGIAGDSLCASIFDPDLNILVSRFGIFPGSDGISLYFRAASDGENFYIALHHADSESEGIYLIVLSPAGEILSVQTVFDEFSSGDMDGMPAVSASGGTIRVTYFNDSELYLRRYDSVGTPMDPGPVKICAFEDFEPVLLLNNPAGGRLKGYMDWIHADGSFLLFWPKNPEPGITMIDFRSDFSTNAFYTLNSQCQFDPGNYLWSRSYSFIRAASLGDHVMAAWIDGREGEARVYGNFIDVKMYTEVKQEEVMIPETFSLSQNFPNPFNSETVIGYQLPVPAQVTLEVCNTVGQRICVLASGQQPSGFHSIRWDGKDEEGSEVHSGVYFYKLKANRSVAVKKMLVVK
jgi:hypothetical protein